MLKNVVNFSFGFSESRNSVGCILLVRVRNFENYAIANNCVDLWKSNRKYEMRDRCSSDTKTYTPTDHTTLTLI